VFIFFNVFVIIFGVNTRWSDYMNFLEKYGIKIENKDLLLMALTHSSYSNEHGAENYERLEFLGDAVLQLVTSEYFYKTLNNSGEGELSKVRASFVCEEALAQYSKDIGIDKWIRVGNGQLKDINDTIIADCFESVLGAIYLDKGFQIAKDYVLKNENLINCGYKNTGIHKELGKNFQPQYNMVAPICDINSKILNEEEILKTYKSKFRYYLGSFHEKRGITFEITDNISKLDDLITLLKETERKQSINLRNKEYFVKLMENYKGKANLVFGHINLSKYLEFLKNNNGKEEEMKEVQELIKKYGDNMTLSGALMILPSNKKGIRTSEYLYAGNSSYLTKLNVSAGLVFEIIKFSMKNNCHYCNLGGIDGNLNDHLSIFKSKFNGQILEFCGEYDLPINKFLYFNYKNLYPILLKIYKKMR